MYFPENKPGTVDDIVSSIQGRETPLNEYLAAKVSEGFDYSTTGRFIDDFKIRQAEEKAYGADPKYISDPELNIMGETVQPRPIMQEKEWQDSEWYRPGIKYGSVGDMTPVRAQILAEDYDNRRYRESLIQRSPTGLRSVLGFGAAMIGNLPDPVNLIGFGAVGAGRTLGKAALIGAGENMAATALADAIVLPDLAARGEDVGFSDFVVDTMFGAAIGGLFGLGGQALKNATDTARFRAHATERQVMADGLEKAVSDVVEGNPAELRGVLNLDPEGMQRLKEEAGAARVVEPMAETPEPGAPNLKAEIETAVQPYVDASPGAYPTRVISFNEIPEDIAEQARAKRGAGIWGIEGWTDPKKGEVVLVSENLTPERAAEVWMHEQIGHGGLRKVFGDDQAFGGFLDAVAREYGHEGPNSRMMAEEEIARIAEKLTLGDALAVEEKGLWDRLVEAVRLWLINKGLATVKDEDISRVLQDAMAVVTKKDEQRVSVRLEAEPRPLDQAPKWGDPTPEVHTEPKEVIAKAIPDEDPALLMARVDALDREGQLRGVDHEELNAATLAEERAATWGENMLNIAECVTKVVD